MTPSLVGYSSWHLLWALAAVAGIAVILRVLRRQGVPLAATLLLLAALPVATLIGAKALYLAENGAPAVQALSAGGYRGPGGLVAAAAALVGLCWWLRIPVLATLDAVAPAFALVMAIGRIGCFVEGCCFGPPSTLPWAMAYPAGSPAHASHAAQQLIAPGAAESLAVHPLALYFSLEAVALLAFLLWLRPRAAYAGQVFLTFAVLHFWSKAGLETLRGASVGSALNRSGEAGFWIALVASAVLLAVTLARLRRGERILAALSP
jgi:phosphatidylglycerol:prolipoprotein diacylglycerol transferase